MNPDSSGFWILMAPFLGVLVLSVATYIKAAAAARFGVRAADSIHELKAEINGNRQGDLSRASAAGRSEGVIEGREHSCVSASLAIQAAELQSRAMMDAAAVKAVTAIESAASRAVAILSAAETKAMAIVNVAETKAAEVLARAEAHSPGDHD